VERRAVVLLFTLSAASSVLLDAGVVCSNDGSHYALVRALADTHTASIDSFVAYTRWVDYAWRDGHAYSDRPPGTAMAALPFYLAARTLGMSEPARESATCGLSILAGALAVTLAFRIGRRLGLSLGGATVAALTLAMATPLRTYSSVLFSHALAACLVAAYVLLALSNRPAFVIGLLIGYGVTVDYSTAIVGAVVVVAVARGRLIPLVAGLMVGILPALVYHTLVFGSPLATPYRFFARTAWPRSFRTTYDGSPWTGVPSLLFGWRGGLLLYSPILLAGLAALPRWRCPPALRLLLLPALPLTLLTALHHTWFGGGTNDARYLVPVVPLLCVPIGAAWDLAHESGRRGILLLLFLSAQIQLVKHAVGWSRDVSPWLSELARHAETDLPAAVLRFAAWSFPHPVAAALVLLAGAGASALQRAQLARAQSASQSCASL